MAKISEACQGDKWGKNYIDDTYEEFQRQWNRWGIKVVLAERLGKSIGIIAKFRRFFTKWFWLKIYRKILPDRKRHILMSQMLSLVISVSKQLKDFP